MNLEETIYLGNKENQNSQETTEFIIFTDLHYISSKINVGKSLQKILKQKGDLKEIEYVCEITDCLIDEIIKYKPSGGVIICGDLTYDGEKISHQEVRKKLQKLIDNNIRVYLVPGNHDINNYNATKYRLSEREKVEFVSKDEFEEIYKDCGFSKAVSQDKDSLSYIASITDNLSLIMLDTNFYENNNPKNPVAIKGVLQESTYQWLESYLKKAKEQNINIIAVTHHSLVDHSELINKGYTLENNNRLIELYIKYNVILNLSGHLHIQHIKPAYNGKDLDNRKIYDISTSSIVVYRNQYAILSYINNKEIYYRTKVLEVSKWAKENNYRDKNLLNFEQYSYKFSYNQTYKKIYMELLESNLSKYDAKLMSFVLSELNPEFFSGTVVEIYKKIKDSSSYKKWSTVNDIFYHKYIESIMKEKKFDHNTLRLSIRQDDGSFGNIIWK